MQTRSKLTKRIEEEPALAAALGCAAGLTFSILFVGFASLFSAPTLASIVALHFSSAILGGVASIELLCKESVETPVLKVLRYLSLAVPAFIVLQSGFANEAYELAGTTITGDAFVGFRMLMAATLAGLGLPVAEEWLARDEDSFDRESAETRYRAAIRRLAAMDVAIEDSRAMAERQLAEFDQRLRMEVEFDFEKVTVDSHESVALR